MNDIRTSIDTMQFSEHTLRILHKYRITTMEELASYSEYDLIVKVRGLGRRGFDEIKRKLGVLGYELRKE